MHKSEKSNVENYVTDSQTDRQTDRGSWFRWSGGQGGSYITPSPLGLNFFELSEGSDSSKRR